MAPLRRPTIRCQYHYATDERQDSENRRNGDRIVLFFGSLNRTDIQNFLVRRVRNALIGQPHDSQNNQDDAEDSHIFAFFTTCAVGGPSM